MWIKVFISFFFKGGIIKIEFKTRDKVCIFVLTSRVYLNVVPSFCSQVFLAKREATEVLLIKEFI